MGLKTFWLATRIAVAFMALMVAVLLAATFVFHRTIGGSIHHAIVEARTSQALLFVGEVESELAARAITVRGDDGAAPEATRHLLDELGRQRLVTLALLTPEREVITLAGVDERGGRHLHGPWRHQRYRDYPCGGRTCQVGHRPPFPVLVPLGPSADGPPLLLGVSHAPPAADRRALHLGLLVIAGVAFLGVVGFALYLTIPLRQVSRAIDRVAQGDLDHRVPVRGRDEVARVARSFNAMADRIAHMIRSRKEMMAGASHELRSPLSRMKLSLEMLRDSGADAKRLDSLEEDIDALDAMVEELSLASKLDLQHEPQAPQALSLAELVQEGWKRANHPTEKVELRLGDNATMVEADPALAKRILGNLLENAARHGGGEPVAVTSRRQEDRVVVSVTDEGPGVPHEALERIFEPFYRVDSSRSRRTGGSGLGLMIVRRAVEAHGGTIEATRGDGGGLVMTFDLPAAVRK
jgi:signal transduction histidine kinase